MKKKSTKRKASKSRTARPATRSELIVLGMHRSGTSALTGALSLCGAWVGDEAELTGSNPENPKGFWERRDVRSICDQLLHAAGADWWKVTSFELSAIPHLAISEQGRAFREVVKTLDSRGTWVLKEPRLCLLLPALRSNIGDPVCIHVVRNPLRVAQSLRARNGFGIVEGVALWEAYVLSALKVAAGLPQVLVSYESVVSKPEQTIKALLSELKTIGVTSLSLPEPGILNDFIIPSLQRQQTDIEGASDFLLPSQRELWTALKSGQIPDVNGLKGLSDAARQHLRDLESRQQMIVQLSERLKARGDEIRKLGQAHRTQTDELEKTLKSRDAQTNKIAEQLTAQRARTVGLEEDLTKRKTNIQKLEKQLEAQRARTGDLEKQLEAQRTKAGELKTRLDDLNKHTRAQQAQIHKLQSELASKNADARTLNEKIEARKLRIDALETEVRSYQDRTAKLVRELGSEAKRADDLAARVRKRERRIRYFESSVSWRLTAPLRTVYRASTWSMRTARHGLLFIWWIATGRVEKSVRAAYPAYIRHVPAFLKALLPSSLRKRMRSRFIVSHRNRSDHDSESKNKSRSTPAAEKKKGSEELPARILNTATQGSTFGKRVQEILAQVKSTKLREALKISEMELANAAVQLTRHTHAPLVSIIMPTFNRSDIISDAVQSVIDQHYTNWELFICDDGSTDDTESTVARFSDARIKYCKLAKRGAAVARNHGLEQARGELFAYLDSDNIWSPFFLTKMVLTLLERPGQSSVYSDYVDYKVDKAGKISIKATKRPKFIHENLLKKNFIDLNSFVHRRELYDTFGGFNENLIRRQDYDLILKYTWLRDPFHVDNLLTLYQRNERLIQITTAKRHDKSCIPIINQSLEGYFKSGLPRNGERPVKRITILSWDMCRNHFSKPFALAEALSEEYDVQLISFRFFEEPIFPPLVDVEPVFETLYFDGSDFPEFFDAMKEAADAISGEIIYVVKPRLPSLGVALLANAMHVTPIILEINDLETVVSSPKKHDKHVEATFDNVDFSDPRLRSPYSDIWSQLMDPLAKRLPVLTTHNKNIDAHFGHRCLYMRNLKDEAVYDPALYDRDAVRAELGFVPGDRVILFGGLLRKHKGVYELVELVERLDNHNYKLLFVGSRPTPDQNQLIERYGEQVRVLPPQSRGEMARINYAADLVILWLDPSVPASHYQMPYKATDAFAMGPSVIANDISDLGSLASQGYLNIVQFGDLDRMHETIHGLFEEPDQTSARREAARRLYLRQFSYAAARSNFEIAARRAQAAERGPQPASVELVERLNEFHRCVTGATTGFVKLKNITLPLPSSLHASGHGQANEDSHITILDVKHLHRLTFSIPDGVAVVMPSIDTSKALLSSRLLVKRAGMNVKVFIVNDTLRQGFIKTLNDTAARLNAKYIVYLAEDAVPGSDWLKTAYITLERTAKGLLAFNDGKWRGRIAAFGMVRISWVRTLYGGPILFPGYISHKADNELTAIARAQDMFVYDSDSNLFEYDRNKIFADKSAKDPKLFRERFLDGFNGLVPIEYLIPYAQEYRVPLSGNSAKNTQARSANSKLFPEISKDFTTETEVIEGSNARSRFSEYSGIVVMMHCTDLRKGTQSAEILAKRAGLDCKLIILHDPSGVNFVNMFRTTADCLHAEYLVCLTEDAFPGLNWLLSAYETIRKIKKGLLAFNDGVKSRYFFSQFCMIDVRWARSLYNGAIFCAEYNSSAAVSELIAVALSRNQYVYEPNSVLFSHEPTQAHPDRNPLDQNRVERAIFDSRFDKGFDGLVSNKKLAPLAAKCAALLERTQEPTSAKRILETHALQTAGLTNLRAVVLESEIQSYQSGLNSDLAGVIDRLIANADEAIARGLHSVVDKTSLPPSGNPHDYWHPAPYWWPNPDTADGLPYVNRDGRRVPGTRMYEPSSEKYDRTRLQRVFDDSLVLILAWSFSGLDKYLRHGTAILEHFFVNPDTRMTPHLCYSQVRMGHDNNMGFKSGIIEMKDMYYYLDAVRVMSQANAIPKPILQSFEGWLDTYLDWLLQSSQGVDECKTTNNHGNYYDLQVASIGAFLGQEQVLSETLARAQSRIQQHFQPDGSQPRELKRNTSAHYCCFNFQGWINLAELASRYNIDLWDYETDNGAGMKSGARWLLSYMNKSWPYKQIDNFDKGRFLPIWFASKAHLDDLPRDQKTTSPYCVKPVFFPHDGIRPFWNLGTY